MDEPLVGLRNRVLLLVEDDDYKRNDLRDSLNREGYTVVECCGPIEALDFAQENAERLDGIILDIMMPDQDQFPAGPDREDDVSHGERTGILLLPQLAKVFTNAGRECPPVIVLTAYNHLNDLEKLRQHNRCVVTVIHRPAKPKELLRALEDNIG